MSGDGGIGRNDGWKINEFEYEELAFEWMETILIDWNSSFLKKSTLCLGNPIFPPIG